jgi:hypothetical protein
MKTLTKEKLKLLLLYKEERDKHAKICDNLYCMAMELLDLDDSSGWLVDYFENDVCTLESMLLHLGIEKEK